MCWLFIQKMHIGTIQSEQRRKKINTACLRWGINYVSADPLHVRTRNDLGGEPQLHPRGWGAYWKHDRRSPAPACPCCRTFRSSRGFVRRAADPRAHIIRNQTDHGMYCLYFVYIVIYLNMNSTFIPRNLGCVQFQNRTLINRSKQGTAATWNIPGKNQGKTADFSKGRQPSQPSYPAASHAVNIIGGGLDLEPPLPSPPRSWREERPGAPGGLRELPRGWERNFFLPTLGKIYTFDFYAIIVFFRSTVGNKIFFNQSM